MGASKKEKNCTISSPTVCQPVLFASGVAYLFLRLLSPKGERLGWGGRVEVDGYEA